MQRQVDASHRIRMIFPWKMYFKTEIGKHLNVIDTRLPSHVDSGSLDSKFEVVGRDINISDGTIIVDFEGVPSGVLVAPSVHVLSYNSGTQEVTIDSSGVLGDTILYDEEGANDFPKTCNIRIWRAASNFSTYEDNSLGLATLDNVVQLKSAPTVSPAAGDIITILDGDDEGPANLNHVGADVQDFAYGADSSYQIGTGSYLRDGPRWG